VKIEINYLAVLVASAVCFVLGGAWYSPALFGGAWMRENGYTPETLAGRSMPLVFGTSFALTALMALNLAAFLSGPTRSLAWGLTAGALAGVGWIACGFGVTYLFERRSFKLFLINAGYHAVTMTLMGAILGGWR